MNNIWKVRSKCYNELNWTHEEKYINEIVKACNLKSYYQACDVGCGTGIVTHALSQYCHKVYGIDISEDMLKKAENNSNTKNIFYGVSNAEKIDFPDNRFEVVTARMVFHHIVNPIVAANECFRVLKPGYKFVISEGIPPYGARDFHKKFLTKKEKRRIFTVDDLIELLEKARFEDIDFVIHKMENVSIKNWLNNSGLPKEKQIELYKMRLDSPYHAQKAENMKIANGDILTDWHFAIVSGVKPID